jgi:hypothetical protein
LTAICGIDQEKTYRCSALLVIALKQIVSKAVGGVSTINLGGLGMDVEIDRRKFNGRTIVLLEDRARALPDGASKQYVIGIEIKSKKTGKLNIEHKRFISPLITRLGFDTTYEGAKYTFDNLETARSVLGDSWYGYYREARTSP